MWVCYSSLVGVGGEAEEEPARKSRDYADLHDLYFVYKWFGTSGYWTQTIKKGVKWSPVEESLEGV